MDASRLTSKAALQVRHPVLVLSFGVPMTASDLSAAVALWKLDVRDVMLAGGRRALAAEEIPAAPLRSTPINSKTPSNMRYLQPRMVHSPSIIVTEQEMHSTKLPVLLQFTCARGSL